MYTYHYVLQIFKPSYRIQVFRDVMLVGKCEVFKPANQPNRKDAETPNFTAATFPNQWD
jgi:hypothetical protein